MADQDVHPTQAAYDAGYTFYEKGGFSLRDSPTTALRAARQEAKHYDDAEAFMDGFEAADEASDP